MRQSLSENERVAPAGRVVWLAVALSAVLAAAAMIDQFGLHSLTDHAAAMYGPYGKRAEPGLLYGLVYAAAVVEALVWLPVIWAVRSRSRLASLLAVVAIAVTAALAVLLLVSTEYGAQVYPPLWGTLAILSPAAGVLALALLFRRSP